MHPEAMFLPHDAVELYTVSGSLLSLGRQPTDLFIAGGGWGEERGSPISVEGGCL